MNDPNTEPAPFASPDPVHQIAKLASGFSLEATLPSSADIDALGNVAPAAPAYS